MSKLKRYIGQTILFATIAVLFVIVALDTIFQIVDELDRMKGDYGFIQVLQYAIYNVPNVVYEFIPLSALVGCLIGLGTLASSSELVVMRAAGVNLRQVIWSVFRPVLLMILFGSLVGEYIAPYSGQYADSQRALAQGHQQSLRSERGVWNREGNEFMHFNAVLPNGKLFGITRFQFDDEKNLQNVSFVDSAIYQGEYWFEQDGEVTHFDEEKISRSEFTSRRWYTDISPSFLDVLVLKPEELPLKRLHEYSVYLEKENLDASDYRLAFWQKSLQPLATLSLVMIAISFILGPLRQVTMGLRVFVGILVGLVFQTAQKLLGPASIVWGFSPLIAVMIPIVLSFFIGLMFLRRAQ